MPRKSVRLLISLHVGVACFFLPAAAAFLVTGAFYTIDVKGSYHVRVHEIPIAAPLAPDLDHNRAKAAAFLAAHDLAPPTGGDRLRRFGTSFAYEWHGSNRDVLLSPTDNPAIARIEVKDTTLFRRFVQLHKAKGGALFKGYAVAFSIGLLSLLLTGAAVAWARRPLRAQAAVMTALGIAAFAASVLLS